MDRIFAIRLDQIAEAFAVGRQAQSKIGKTFIQHLLRLRRRSRICSSLV